ncbi:MAG TPA: PDZ domain-containing protein [Longimicrobiales bacterium]|nr:PDZ domain-containing protein [Longimicrobiales bacterium]
MRIYRIVAALLAIGVLTPAAASAQERVRVFANPGARGMLGFSSEPVRGEGLHERVIVDVVPDSPADSAGLEKGDTLVRINGLAASPQVMRAPFQPGDTVTLRIRRDGRERDITVIAAERRDRISVFFPDSLDERFAVTFERMRAHVDSAHAMPDIAIRRFGTDSGSVIVIGADTVHIRSGMPEALRYRLHADSFAIHRDSIFRHLRTEVFPHVFADSADFRIFTPMEGRQFQFHTDSAGLDGFRMMAANAVFGLRAVAGAELAPLNPALAEYFGATDGVLVLNAAGNTPAERAGLRGGDVIVSVDDTAVRSISELRRAIDRASGDVILRVLRHGRNVDITLEL